MIKILDRTDDPLLYENTLYKYDILMSTRMTDWQDHIETEAEKQKAKAVYVVINKSIAYCKFIRS